MTDRIHMRLFSVQTRPNHYYRSFFNVSRRLVEARRRAVASKSIAVGSISGVVIALSLVLFSLSVIDLSAQKLGGREILQSAFLLFGIPFITAFTAIGVGALHYGIYRPSLQGVREKTTVIEYNAVLRASALAVSIKQQRPIATPDVEKQKLHDSARALVVMGRAPCVR